MIKEVCFMEYDDFSLTANFEKMSKEYHKALQEKGFVFVRLDEIQTEKEASSKQAYLSLMSAVDLYQKINYRFKNKFASTLNNLKNLTQFQIKDFEKMYPHAITQKKEQFKFPSFDKIISVEATVLKNLFHLLDLEDEPQKHTLIKNMITSRLEILAE